MLARVFIVRVLALALFLIPVRAQEGPQERAARLRAQLADVQAQQTELQTRFSQVNEDLKPENIERSLAGVGSTHPEDLREARRRQLEIQRKGIQSQLDSLEATRARLETAITSADAESYRQTANPNTSSLSTTKDIATKGTATKHSHRKKHRLKSRRLHR